jgi:carbamoyltransferase
MFLGIKTGGHDTSAALVDESAQIVAAVAEERLDRVKHSAAFPARAIAACLEVADADMSDVRGVYVPYCYWRAVLGAGVAPALRHRGATLRSALQLARRLDRRRRTAAAGLRALGCRTRAVSFDHHDCHATSAYLTSPFDDACVLTVDGRGEHASIRVYAAQAGRIRRLATLGRYPHSVGLLYSAVTRHLGFEPDCDEGTVMALASYGDPGRFEPAFDRLLSYSGRDLRLDLGLYAHHRRPRWRLSDAFSRLTCAARDPREEILVVHADLAAGLQAATRRVALAAVADATALARSRNLCLAGGVALNSVINGAVARSGLVDRLHVQSAPGDDGASLGAALLGRRRTLGHDDARPAATPFLGPRSPVGHRSAIRDFLAAQAGRYELHGGVVAREAAVRQLAEGMVVGLFEGRAEFGPRALGHRSILADPSRADIANVLNARVKFRQPFRPFAVAVLLEAVDDLFVAPIESPHMSMVFPVRPAARRRLAGVTHVDGTVRVQTVGPDGPATLRALLREFHRRTGVPALINTSLNVKGQPIVDTPREALVCLAATDMDSLLLGDRLVSKTRAAESVAGPARWAEDYPSASSPTATRDQQLI